MPNPFPPHSQLNNALTDFFSSYQRAWDRLQGDEIASHYSARPNILDGDGFCAYAGVEELVAKFEANCEAFRQRGYRGSSFTIEYCSCSGEFSAVADLAWSIHFTSEVVDFRTTYMCVLEQGNWSVISAVVYQ